MLFILVGENWSYTSKLLLTVFNDKHAIAFSVSHAEK